MLKRFGLLTTPKWDCISEFFVVEAPMFCIRGGLAVYRRKT